MQIGFEKRMAKYHGNHNDNHMLVIEGRQSSPLGVQSTLGGEFNARENTHRRKASETTQVRVCEPQSNLSLEYVIGSSAKGCKSDALAFEPHTYFGRMNEIILNCVMRMLCFYVMSNRGFAFEIRNNHNNTNNNV